MRPTIYRIFLTTIHSGKSIFVDEKDIGGLFPAPPYIPTLNMKTCRETFC